MNGMECVGMTATMRHRLVLVVERKKKTNVASWHSLSRLIFYASYAFFFVQQVPWVYVISENRKQHHKIEAVNLKRKMKWTTQIIIILACETMWVYTLAIFIYVHKRTHKTSTNLQKEIEKTKAHSNFFSSNHIILLINRMKKKSSFYSSVLNKITS